jgi:uroporphyrin-III C-methyltransferase/precorrin-2 dehydrogenase/sirohydrochlorin ferrochelatase
MSDPYLAGLQLENRKVVVVGGGVVAARRVPTLLAAGAIVEVIAPEVTMSIEAMVTAGEITWRERGYQTGDLAGAWYVLTCANVSDVNALVAEDAQAQRTFCVRADRSGHGSAVTPAIGRVQGLAVGILASGNPRRSAAVRDNVVAGLESGIIDDRAEKQPAGVALVGGGPGDPELITVRGRRLLAKADVVVTDRLGPRDLLDELPPHVEIIDVSKIPYGRQASQDYINETLIKKAQDGKFVVRLKGGDSFVFGRGFEELLVCAEAGIPVTVVPGVTSAFSAPALDNIPVTHRGIAHEVVVVSGHVAPDDPASMVNWPALAQLNGTLVLLMAVKHSGEFAKALIAGGRPAATPAAVIADGSMRTQTSIRTTLANLKTDLDKSGIRPPAIIVIGDVAALG